MDFIMFHVEPILSCFDTFNGENENSQLIVFIRELFWFIIKEEKLNNSELIKWFRALISCLRSSFPGWSHLGASSSTIRLTGVGASSQWCCQAWIMDSNCPSSGFAFWSNQIPIFPIQRHSMDRKILDGTLSTNVALCMGIVSKWIEKEPSCCSAKFIT